jgi:hypothetical protein
MSHPQLFFNKNVLFLLFKIKVMEPIFGNIVGEIYELPLEEKQQLLEMLERNITESRRDEIYKNYLAAKAEEEDGKLSFSSNIDQLTQKL